MCAGPTIGGIVLAHAGVKLYPLVAAAGYGFVCVLLILLFGWQKQKQPKDGNAKDD